MTEYCRIQENLRLTCDGHFDVMYESLRACDVLSMYACGLKFELFMYVGMLVITCD